MDYKNIKNIIKDKIKIYYFLIKDKIIKLKKEQKIILLLGIFLSILCYFANNGSIFVGKNTIRRQGYGGVEQVYNLYVKGISKHNEEYSFTVSNRKYTREEADKLFNDLYDRTIKNILGKNTNFNDIKYDLILPTKYKQEGVEVLWEFEPHDNNITENAQYFRKYQKTISSNGKVNNENLKKDEIVKGYLKFKFTAFINEELERYESPKYLIDIEIHSRELTKEEENRIEFIEKLSEANNNSKEKEVIILPIKLSNTKISYIEKKNLSFVVVLCLFIGLAFLVSYKDKKQKEDLEKKKVRKYILDYPNIVSKLLIYIGCGLTCRNAFIKIAKNYDDNVEKGIQVRSPSYDELNIMANKLQSGVPEKLCYAEFAKNINYKVYTRFINIIEQNIKNGNATLMDTLQIEAMDAFEERKLNATKLGEEASTKLIFPLMIMLSIVMIVVMVPALMAF